MGDVKKKKQGRTLICALMMGQGKKDGSMYGESEKETLQVLLHM